MSSSGPSSGCGHPDCDPDECWVPSATKPKTTPKKRRPAWIKPLRAIEECRCPRCKTRLWTAWDADVMALRATVEADVFLNSQGEERAIARGRHTYEYVFVPSRRLEARDPWQVKGRPAGTRSLHGSSETLVTVEHVCGRPVPRWAIYEPPFLRRPRPSDQPPF